MKNTGLTLIELIIALAICGILAAVGGASFYAQSQSQRLYAMRAALLHLEAEQANQRLLTQTYASSLPPISDNRFSVQVIHADSRDFVMKATSHLETGGECDALTVTSTSRSPASCWE